MHNEYRVHDFQAWINGYERETVQAVQAMQYKIQAAKGDIDDWDTLMIDLRKVRHEKNELHQYLFACRIEPDNSSEEANAQMRIMNEIRAEIFRKEIEENDLLERIHSRTEDLRRWKLVFGDESFYNAMGKKLMEGKNKRAEIEQYTITVQQADEILGSEKGSGGILNGNRYGAHISGLTNAVKDQLGKLMGMPRTLLDIERKLVVCTRMAAFVLDEIARRIGDPDPEKDYGQKRL